MVLLQYYEVSILVTVVWSCIYSIKDKIIFYILKQLYRTHCTSEEISEISAPLLLAVELSRMWLVVSKRFISTKTRFLYLGYSCSDPPPPPLPPPPLPLCNLFSHRAQNDPHSSMMLSNFVKGLKGGGGSVAAILFFFEIFF